MMIFFFVDYDCILLKAEVLSTVPSHVSLSECNRSRGECGCTLSLLMNFKEGVFVVHNFQKM